MGWFLVSKRKKKKTKSARRNGGAKPFDPHVMLWFIRCMTVLGAVGLTIASWQWAEHALTEYVGTHEAVAVTPHHVVLTSRPGWMSPMLTEELQQLVSNCITADPLRGQSLEQAASVLANSAWVAAVKRVRRETDGRIIVDAVYRAPTALIEWRDGYRLVDNFGIRLPGLYLDHQVDQLEMPIITGATSGPSSPGNLWPGEDVQAGLKLVAMLKNERFASQIRAYDVSGRDERNRMRLALQTFNGGLVRWGLPPGDEQSLEPDARIKLQWLAAIHRQRGQIDAGGKIVDLYGPAVFVHQTANASETAHQIGYTW